MQFLTGIRGNRWYLERAKIIAPQAQLEESANDRTSRRCPLVDFFKRNRLPILGTAFERFCDWYLSFSCRKLGPGRARDRPDFLCLFDVLFFCRTTFRAGRWTYNSLFRKNRSENGIPHRMRRRDGPFSGPAPIRLIRGRWHSPQVAPAAPPAPRVHSSTVRKTFGLRRLKLMYFPDKSPENI